MAIPDQIKEFDEAPHVKGAKKLLDKYETLKKTIRLIYSILARIPYWLLILFGKIERI